jgi:hypothetical protein
LLRLILRQLHSGSAGCKASQDAYEGSIPFARSSPPSPFKKGLLAIFEGDIAGRKRRRDKKANKRDRAWHKQDKPETPKRET